MHGNRAILSEAMRHLLDIVAEDVPDRQGGQKLNGTTSYGRQLQHV